MILVLKLDSGNGNTLIGGSGIVVDELTVNNNINGDFNITGNVVLNNVRANDLDVSNRNYSKLWYYNHSSG